MIIKSYNKLLTVTAGVLLLVFTASSCKKDSETQPEQVALELPSEVSLTYGETIDLDLPAEFTGQDDVSFQLEFNETANIQINNESKLHDKLGKAVKVNKETGKIHIDSRLLYPNGGASSVNGSKIPDDYKIRFIAGSKNGAIEGRQTLSLKILPARVQVKDIVNSDEVPFAYVLYSDEQTSFELEAPSILIDGASWYLPLADSTKSIISRDGNLVKFAANAGDPKKEAERAYDLEPTLQKDGFPVASTKLRVIFIPQIKFFFGAYIPELNIKQLLNYLHIALPRNGYKSNAPTLYPDKYKSTFSLISVEKDGKAFQNSDGIFEVDSKTGEVIVKQNTSLAAGAYKFIVKAATTTGLEFTTDLTLNMSEL